MYLSSSLPDVFGVVAHGDGGQQEGVVSRHPHHRRHGVFGEPRQTVRHLDRAYADVRRRILIDYSLTIH